MKKKEYFLSMSKKEEIIKELANKYKISEEEAEKAVTYQFKFAKEHMEDERLPAIRLPFFGIFKPNKKKLKHIKKHNEKRKQRKDN